jgi:hypothetical protein
MKNCGFPHPGGMHRLVENGVPIQNMHPIGDASLQDADMVGYFIFSTERHIPDGM